MRHYLTLLAKPALLFYALPWLMVMLVLGTVAQRYIGLYQAEKIFFGSFIFWLWIIPLPGTYTTLGIIALGLVSKLLLKSPWRKQNIGIIITHCSVLVLLVGGLVTSVAREEGYMVLGDNEVSHSVSDYQTRELVVTHNDSPIFTTDALQAGNNFISPALPFAVTIRNYYRNCQYVNNTLVPLSDDTEEAKNQAGITVEIQGKTYVILQGTAKMTEFTAGKDKYQIMIRQAERAIPFSVRLLHFEKSEHPGTNIARSYSSKVEVQDGALKWQALIAMNEPLRYRGYTLYQSSFIENEDKVMTVLAVVKNAGALFPYLAIASLCIGLAIHLALIFMRRKI